MKASNSTVAKGTTTTTTSMKWRWRLFLLYVVSIFAHISSIFVLVVGVILSFQKLYTAQECDMTWSQRQFLAINPKFMATNHHPHHPPHPSKYRVFKFTDQRDPRHQSFLDGTAAATNHNAWFCLPSSEASSAASSASASESSSSSESSSGSFRTAATAVVVVLYVPGHGGSYEQSRSLGAHGIQLTEGASGSAHEQRILQQLHNLHQNAGLNNNNNNSNNNGTFTTTESSFAVVTDLADFFYDVYALDFGEEGGAFHGTLLERQAAFIADTVHELTTACSLDQIHIVAHSMGGISTRWALQTYPDHMRAVQNVVTLGTPHAQTVWSWEPSMLNLYRRLWQQQPETTWKSGTVLVSISGGLRDEMIPPRACRVHGRGFASLLSTDIMHRATMEGKDSPPAFGMDHKAIVWCHNLLSQVRFILYKLIRTETDASRIGNDRMTSLLLSLQEQQGKVSFDKYDYLLAEENLRTTLTVRRKRMHCIRCVACLCNIL